MDRSDAPRAVARDRPSQEGTVAFDLRKDRSISERRHTVGDRHGARRGADSTDAPLEALGERLFSLEARDGTRRGELPLARAQTIDLVLSDGEANGGPLMAAAHDAAARGLPIDVRAFSRGETADIAVESLDPPGVVDEREPFQFTASVRTDRTVETDAVLFRDGVVVPEEQFDQEVPAPGRTAAQAPELAFQEGGAFP